MNYSKKQLAILLAVVAVFVIGLYLYFTGDFACCLKNGKSQRMCYNIEYIKERLNMTINEWSGAVNCTSRVVRCKYDAETDEVVCPIPMEWW